MMNNPKPLSPERWAFDLTHVLNAVFGAERFPIDVKSVAIEYSRQRFPDDPITMVKGAALPKFDGGLFKAPDGKKGWGIIYNDAFTSIGRINYTLAHEFGHYLMHRLEYPDGMKCGEQDFVRWDSNYGKVEHQANVFAATLLMPLDDFRRQIDPKVKINLDMLGNCANRYQVSLIAAILRWIQYTERRAVLVLSRDGFILWARSSQAAFKSGVFFRTANRPPVAIPADSLAAQGRQPDDLRKGKELPADVWFAEPCEEMVIFSEQYNFVISLLSLDSSSAYTPLEEETEPDVADYFAEKQSGDNSPSR